MNIEEAAKAAGFESSTYGLNSTPGMYAYNMEIVERFAKIIRNKALEDAKATCAGIGAGYTGAARRLRGVQATLAAGMRDGANECAAAIRAMKEQT